MFKQTSVEELTEANSSANLSCTNLLLFDVICIWFIDKKLFTLATPKNSQVDRLYASSAMKDKAYGINAFFVQEQRSVIR